MAAQGKRRLLDAENRVEDALRRFDKDPESTLDRLRHLNTWFAPDPHVLHAMALCLHRSGKAEEAARIGRRAVLECVERGYTYLAAQVFQELRLTFEELPEDKEPILTLAAFLARTDDLAGAARAYSWVVRQDPNGARAVRGLLDLAEQILSERSKPAAARRIFFFLLKHCPQSYFAGIIREGLERCDEALRREPAHRG